MIRKYQTAGKFEWPEKTFKWPIELSKKEEKKEEDTYTKYKRKRDEYIQQRLEAQKQFAPVRDNSRMLKLTDAGNQTHANIPINVLDSIALNAGRANIAPYKAFGLVGKESTFQSEYGSKPWEGQERISPHAQTLVNDHDYYYNNKWSDEIETVKKKVYEKYNPNTLSALAFEEYLADPENFDQGKHDRKIAAWREENQIGKLIGEFNKQLRNDFPYLRDRQSKEMQQIKPLLQHAFVKYRISPESYNPKQENYVQMVESIGKAIVNDLGFQKFWNSEGRKFYDQGLKEYRTGTYPKFE